MKVLVGSFTAESNSWNPFNHKLEQFNIGYDDVVGKNMFCEDIFKENGIEAIPTIYANGGANGYIEKSSFMFIADKIIDKAIEKKNEIDGVLMFLHGASHVLDLDEDAGELYILKKVREIVGKDIPIAITMDPHGNVTESYTELANIIRCYRQSPHWDREQTHRDVAELFVKLLKNPKNIKPEYERVPILVGGSRSVSADEPMNSINNLLDKAETLEGIMSASYHIGYSHADSPLCAAGVVVVPENDSYQSLASQKAKEIAKFAMDNKEAFHFTNYTVEPDKAVEEAITTTKKTVFITDSGDDATGGSFGYNTLLLRMFLERSDLNNKKVLFASVHDPAACNKLMNHEIGDYVSFSLGVAIDDESQQVIINGNITAMGDLNTFYAFPHKIGDTVTVKIDDTDIYIVVANHLTAFREVQQFEKAGLDYKDYDIIVVKQGYLYTDLLELSDKDIMALTPGITYKKIEDLEFKNLIRPIYPLDKDAFK
ncbi:M81 family metallopeptidase [Oceanobacillus neutriphilus]|uniref:Microcystinase C n=1 Tax=Oceanobacillus neutriphilus TaxID=531815 RepID=A0ABQ2NP95_9BACI|nr:M81 family metallopeptidase [Oceanobacillus neutriphilus]GGP07834.1 microcystinase C [Oceanobacillus neutriphilus]